MRILLELLPVLPAVLYILYYVYKGRKLGKDEILVGLKQGNWLAVFVVCMFFTIVVVLLLAAKNSEYKGDKYTPAKFENGVLQPSKIEK